MRNVNPFVLGVCLLASAALFSACDAIDPAANVPTEEQALQKNGDIIPGQYIVVLDAQSLGKNAAVALTSILEEEKVAPIFRYTESVYGFAAAMSDEQAQRLASDPRVRRVEPDRLITLGKPSKGGGGSNPAQTTPWGISRIGGSRDGTGKTAWIIDSGIDLDHPDLNVDTGKSRTFITSGRDARSADDGNGHGTHVAGTVAARNNSIGVVGVAAGATVVAVKVLNAQGSGSYSGVIAGINYVAGAARSGDVANMSLGGPVSQALDDAVVAAAAKGIRFALAAGNETDDASNHSPARAEHANIRTVSAIGQNDCLASFSNFGGPVDVAAPGVGVQSTYKDGGYASLSGTSMASPHVAGLLLFGTYGSDGTACNDTDGKPDPIAHF